MITTKFSLSGLHCESCAKVSQLNISDIPGVKHVAVVQRGSEADGVLEADREVSLDEISKALAGTGYSVHPARQ